MSSSPSPFGQNEWLVEEMYRKFRDDPSSVD
ncbi:2-oxoglutarate dehydrogenase E1 subunit family protein, partial [Mycolicibacterium goodii]